MLGLQKHTHPNTVTDVEGLSLLVIAGRAAGSQGSSFFPQLSLRGTLPGMLVTIFLNPHYILHWKRIFNVCFFSSELNCIEASLSLPCTNMEAALSLSCFSRKTLAKTSSDKLPQSFLFFLFLNKRTFNVYFIFWVVSFCWGRKCWQFWRLPIPYTWHGSEQYWHAFPLPK